MLQACIAVGVDINTDYDDDGLKKLEKALDKDGLAGIKGIGQKNVAAMRRHIAGCAAG